MASDSSEFLEYYLERGFSHIVVIDYEHQESASGHTERTTETVVAKKGKKFIRATLHERLRFLGGPGPGKSVAEEEIAEKEYNKLVSDREMVDSPDALADLERRKKHLAEASKRHAEFLRTAPNCPKCGGGMVSRKGPRGRFWGCSDYPRCTGTASFSAESKRRYRKWADH